MQDRGGRSKRQLSDGSAEEGPPAKSQAVESGGGGGGPRKMSLAAPEPSVSPGPVSSCTHCLQTRLLSSPSLIYKLWSFSLFKNIKHPYTADGHGSCHGTRMCICVRAHFRDMFASHLNIHRSSDSLSLSRFISLFSKYIFTLSSEGQVKSVLPVGPLRHLFCLFSLSRRRGNARRQRRPRVR